MFDLFVFELFFAADLLKLDSMHSVEHFINCARPQGCRQIIVAENDYYSINFSPSLAKEIRHWHLRRYHRYTLNSPHLPANVEKEN